MWRLSRHLITFDGSQICLCYIHLPAQDFPERITDLVQTYARYEHVRTLFEQGLSQRAIARKLRVSRATMSKFVQAEEYPEIHYPKGRTSKQTSTPTMCWAFQCFESIDLLHVWTAAGRTCLVFHLQSFHRQVLRILGLLISTSTNSVLELQNVGRQRARRLFVWIERLPQFDFVAVWIVYPGEAAVAFVLTLRVDADAFFR